MDCPCLTPPHHHTGFERRELGIDEGGSRYAEVSIDRCKRCGQEWLHYFYDQAHYPRSGRWYRAPITPEQARQVTAQTALEVLASHPWHLYGGSYYETNGKRCDAPLDPKFA